MPKQVSILAEMYLETFTGCICDRNRVSVEYKDKCNEKNYQFYNEFCSYTTRPISYRATDALTCFAKAHAWREHRAAVSNDDFFCFPFILNHRAVLKSDFSGRYKTTFECVSQAMDMIRKKKFDSWSKSGRLYGDVVLRYDESAMKKLEDIGRRDLAVKRLYENALSVMRNKTVKENQPVINEVSDLKEKGYSKRDIEALKAKVQMCTLTLEDQKTSCCR